MPKAFHRTHAKPQLLWTFRKMAQAQNYQHLAECPDGFTSPFGDFRPVGSVLKPNQNSLNFIEELYKEFLLYLNRNDST